MSGESQSDWQHRYNDMPGESYSDSDVCSTSLDFFICMSAQMHLEIHLHVASFFSLFNFNFNFIRLLLFFKNFVIVVVVVIAVIVVVVY